MPFFLPCYSQFLFPFPPSTDLDHTFSSNHTSIPPLIPSPGLRDYVSPISSNRIPISQGHASHLSPVDSYSSARSSSHRDLSAISIRVTDCRYVHVDSNLVPVNSHLAPGHADSQP